MREDWKYSTIGESCNINYGTRVVRKRDGGSIYDVYGGGGATFKMDTYNREDCLVVSRFAMSPKCTRFVSGKFFLNDSGLTLSPKEDSGLSEVFMNTILLANNDNIYEYGRGSAQRNLKVDEFCTMPIAYPKSLSEQERIVALLDDQFAKIDQLKANADLQLQAAKDLFQAALKEIFISGKDWKYCTFADTYPIIMGKTPARADNSLWDKKKVSHNLWVSISDISNNEGGYIYDTEEYVSDLATPKMRKVPKGSLLMSFKLTIGKMAFAGDDLYTNEAIIAIPEKRKYNLRFLYYYLSGYEWSTLTDGAEKVKGKTLNKASIGRILLPEIPLPEQERIAARLDKIYEKVKALQANYDQTITLCNDLKQSLLKSIFE